MIVSSVTCELLLRARAVRPVHLYRPIYMYISICICIYIYIYTHTHTHIYKYAGWIHGVHSSTWVHRECVCALRVNFAKCLLYELFDGKSVPERVQPWLNFLQSHSWNIFFIRFIHRQCNSTCITFILDSWHSGINTVRHTHQAQHAAIHIKQHTHTHKHMHSSTMCIHKIMHMHIPSRPICVTAVGVGCSQIYCRNELLRSLCRHSFTINISLTRFISSYLTDKQWFFSWVYQSWTHAWLSYWHDPLSLSLSIYIYIYIYIYIHIYILQRLPTLHLFRWPCTYWQLLWQQEWPGQWHLLHGQHTFVGSFVPRYPSLWHGKISALGV